MRATRVLVIEEGTGVWGAQRWLLRLAPLLEARGVDFVLAAPESSPLTASWAASGRPHVHLPVPAQRRVRRSDEGALSPPLVAKELARTGRMAHAIATAVRSVDADVVHANVHWSHLEGALGARLAGVPSMLVLHEETAAGVAARFRATSVRCATATVAVSEAVKRCLPRAVHDRVEVVPNGVDVEMLRPGPPDPEIRRQLTAEPDAPLALVMCRLDPRKGVDHVIRAVAQTPDDLRVHLAVVGAPSLDPAWGPRLERLGEELLGSRVRFLGARTDVGDVLRASDVLVLASSMEGMPLSILEAHACGTPVVAYPTAGVPEIVRHDETGLLVEPGDISQLAEAISRVVATSDLQAMLRAAGRAQVVRHHDIELQADRQAAAVRRLVPTADRVGLYS